MDSKTLRDRRRFLHQQNQQYPSGQFVEVPRALWPSFAKSLAVQPDHLFRSREFLVQVFHGDFTRLSILRTELNRDGSWKDGISWDELQAIKDGCGFADCDAVEAHPRARDVVNVANIRHLWIVPPEYARFFWRQSEANLEPNGPEEPA